jgi:hypothetical protein
LRREGRYFNCKRREHVSTAYLENKELSKKLVRVVRATSSSIKRKRKIRKARKKESSSKEDFSRIDKLLLLYLRGLSISTYYTRESTLLAQRTALS